MACDVALAAGAPPPRAWPGRLERIDRPRPVAGRPRMHARMRASPCRSSDHSRQVHGSARGGERACRWCLLDKPTRQHVVAGRLTNVLPGRDEARPMIRSGKRRARASIAKVIDMPLLSLQWRVPVLHGAICSSLQYCGAWRAWSQRFVSFIRTLVLGFKY